MPTPRLILHYYPGHYPPTFTDPATGTTAGPGLLLLIDDSKVLFRGKAWGGVSKLMLDGTNPPFTPTPAGTYVLADPAPYATRTWKFSEIKWGTRIKASPSDPTNVWYQLPSTSGKESWASLKRDFGITRSDIERQYLDLYGKIALPKTWVFNAFGPLAVRFFIDKNANGKLDPDSESLSGAMFHTTAENEAEVATGKPLAMGNSHGCIHMQPADRDSLIGMGGLKAGVSLVIHQYWERYGTLP